MTESNNIFQTLREAKKVSNLVKCAKSEIITEANERTITLMKLPPNLKKIFSQSKVKLYSVEWISNLTGNPITTYVIVLTNFELWKDEFRNLLQLKGFGQMSTDDGSFKVPNPTKAPILTLKSLD